MARCITWFALKKRAGKLLPRMCVVTLPCVWLRCRTTPSVRAVPVLPPQPWRPWLRWRLLCGPRCGPKTVAHSRTTVDDQTQRTDRLTHKAMSQLIHVPETLSDITQCTASYLLFVNKPREPCHAVVRMNHDIVAGGLINSSLRNSVHERVKTRASSALSGPGSMMELEQTTRLQESV